MQGGMLFLHAATSVCMFRLQECSVGSREEAEAIEPLNTQHQVQYTHPQLWALSHIDSNTSTITPVETSSHRCADS